MLVGTSCRTVEKCVVDDVDVVCETPCRIFGEGIVDGAGVGGKAPR